MRGLHRNQSKPHTDYMLIGHSNFPGTYDHFLREPIWRQVLEWIAALAPNIKAGEHAISGRKLYATVEEVETVPRKQGLYEAHRRFIDLHYCLDGGEIIEWSPVSTLTAKTKYDSAKDYTHYNLPKNGKACYMTPHTFAIFFPEDAHMPKISDGTNPTVKKVVVKIDAKLIADPSH